MTLFNNLSLKYKFITLFVLITIPLIIICLALFFKIAIINEETQKLSDKYIKMYDLSSEVDVDVKEAFNCFFNAVKTSDEKQSLDALNGTIKADSCMQLISDLMKGETFNEELNKTFEITWKYVKGGKQLAINSRETRKTRLVFIETFGKQKKDFENSISYLRNQIYQNIINSNQTSKNLAIALSKLEQINKNANQEITTQSLTSIIKNNEIEKIKSNLNDLNKYLVNTNYYQDYLEAKQLFAKYENSSVDFKNSFEQANTKIAEATGLKDEVANYTNSLKQEINKLVLNSTKYIDKAILYSRTKLLLGVIIVLILIIFVSLYIIRSIINPLHNTLQKAINLSLGDLTQNIEQSNQSDVVAQLQNSMYSLNTNLKQILQSINQTTNEINATGTDINASAKNMSESANDQASSAEQVSSSIEEMSSSIQQNSENARETEKIAAKTFDTIKTCAIEVGKAVEAMQEIVNKISVIDDIAFQTNILALNAAVEAARAGEHGKGFAVVAAEIRKLAEHSANAAKEIDTVSQQSMNIAQTTKDIFLGVLPEIERTTTLVREITSACQEQASGSNLINNAVQNFNNTTQKFASISEEMASNSQNLSIKANNLVDMIKYFKI
ncbi:MAG: methyl-accepting chemotaxis protein [Bacteroidales bacterium]|nr:methyl-accepting chemotaxis protein [Bacteroidales bacterium]